MSSVAVRNALMRRAFTSLRTRWGQRQRRLPSMRHGTPHVATIINNVIATYSAYTHNYDHYWVVHIYKMKIDYVNNVPVIYYYSLCYKVRRDTVLILYVYKYCSYWSQGGATVTSITHITTLNFNAQPSI